MAYHTFRDRHTCFIADFNTMFRQRFAAVDESRYGACLCTRRDGFTLIFEDVAIHFVNHNPRAFIREADSQRIFCQSVARHESFIVKVDLTETFSELMELFCGDGFCTNTSDAPAGKIQFSEIFFIHAALAQFIAKRRRNGNGAAIFTDQFKPLQRTHGKILSAQIIY